MSKPSYTDDVNGNEHKWCHITMSITPHLHIDIAQKNVLTTNVGPLCCDVA